MKISLIISTIFITFFMSACVTGTSKATGVKFSNFEKPANNSAILYVYTLNKHIPKLDVKTTNIKTKKELIIGNMVSSGYMVTNLVPGKRLIDMNQDNYQGSILIDAKANHIYCLRADVDSIPSKLPLIYQIKLNRVSLPVCKGDISQLKASY